MVLHDVPNDASLLVECAASLDAERFGHRDVHAIYVLAVPDWLEKRIREAEIQNVLHRFFSEIVIDAEYRVLGERAMQRRVERTRGLEIAPEWLLDDDAGAFGAPRSREVLDDRRERAR